ncbi:hypothetical protein [Streptomyces sp. NBC_00209]|uniref:hypothetical protein n=1 Tax=Streptomyces sp. NBC_00209 TaxID=2975682 RepID=UPI003249524C
MASETDRAALADEVCIALKRCCPGSRAELTGPLGSGTADAFSDVDIAWVVPDERFPDFYRSDRRRLLFVRFAGVPLFWRFDLDVRAASVADDPHYDVARLAHAAALREPSLSDLAAQVTTLAAQHLGGTAESATA